MKKVKYVLFISAMAISVCFAQSSQIYVANNNFDIESIGDVFVITGDSNSNIYVGGSFRYINGEVRSNVARLKTDGILDTLWKPNPDISVERIIPTDSGVYLSGAFEYVGGTSRAFVVKVNLNDGKIIHEFNPPAPDNNVYSIALYNNALYIGGAFTSLNGSAASRIAKLDATSGARDTNFTNAPTSFAFINTMAADNSGLYIGGFFTDIGGEPRFCIARVDPSLGNPVASTYLNGANASVRDNVIDGNFLYSIGYFTTMDTASRNYIARMNKTNGVVDSWNPQVDNNSFVMAVLPASNGVYISGVFTNIGGIARTNIVKVRRDDATVVTSFNASADGYIDALFCANNKLFVGGGFEKLNGKPASSIAVLNPDTGEKLSFSNLSIGNPGMVSSAVQLPDGSIIIGGDFISIKGNFLRSIARIMPDGSVDTNFNLALSISPASPYPLRVEKLLTDGTYLYIGGSFHTVLGYSKTNLAKIRISDWTLDTTFSPNPDGEVYALAVTSGVLYVGGAFNTIGGAARTNIAKLNITNGIADSTFIANTDPSTYIADIALDGNALYVCGSFTKINNNTSKYVAKLDATTGTPDTLWTNCADARISSLWVTPSNVYIGGDYYLTKLSKTSALPDPGWTPVVSGYVYSVRLHKDYVYIGGSFDYVGGVSAENICRIGVTSGTVDTNWLPSADSSINAFLFDDPYIYVAGTFSQICGKRQQAFAALTHQPPQINIITINDGDWYRSVADIILQSSVTSPAGYSITSVQYYVNGLLIGSAISAPYTVNWTSITENTYTVRAIAYDETGLPGRSEEINIFIAPLVTAADFDGDRKADPAMNIRNSATGKYEWYAWVSGNAYNKVGPVLPSTIDGYALAGDIDGDRKADPVIVSLSNTPGAPLSWNGWLSGSGYSYSGPYLLGAPLSEPAFGDVDGDQKADPIVCLRTGVNNEWQAWLSGSGYLPSGYIPLGTKEEGYALAADFDGDKKADVAIVDIGETQSVWKVWLSSIGYQPYTPVYFNSPEGIPVAADFDGDGRADPALYVPKWAGYSAGWYGWLSSANYQRYGPYPFTAP